LQRKEGWQTPKAGQRSAASSLDEFSTPLLGDVATVV